MEFKVFAKKLKNVIGGKSNTKLFTKTIFETMMNESGSELLADTSLETFKSYFNGNTSISKVAALILANLNEDDEVSEKQLRSCLLTNLRMIFLILTL